MPKIAYISKNFSESHLEIIVQANEIIEEYAAQGFSLTLRQLYYQFVARDMIRNMQTEYKRLGSIINDGRLAGLIDWDSIEDRTRNLEKNSSWTGPQDIIESVAASYHIDLWKGQDYRPEVWIEKEALMGVIEPICQALDVPYFACRGYTSQSEQWRASLRHRKYLEAGQRPVVFHLGDHDPSGIDMTRDNQHRLFDVFRANVEVRRLALNMDQVEAHSPPPNPAKITDSRFESYSRQYGDESWELDALEPRMIADLIETNVEALIDEDKFQARMAEKEHTKQMFCELADRWDEIEDILGR